MISIIIPCYNASKHIRNCYTYLIQQTKQDWEAIFVNDGSNDNTLELLIKIASKDNRIKIYTQANKGAAKAREYGIEKATGEYITFLDVDDYLSKNAIELFCNIIKKRKVDIIVSNFNIVYNNKIKTPRKIAFDSISNIDYLKLILTGRNGWELWGKLYRKELFDSCIETPSNIRVGEDAAVFIQIVSKATRIMGIKQPLYNYIQTSESASHIKNIRYAEETLQAAFFIEKFLKNKIIYDDIKNEISSMILLFYSNASFKYPLNRDHQYIKYIYKNHIKWQSLVRLPILKFFYIIMLILTNGKIANVISKFKQ